MIVWSAELTGEMIEHLDIETQEELIKALNDNVAITCGEYGVTCD